MAIWEEGSLFAPFPSKMRANTVVFDFPFFDLSRASNVRGAVGWGAHDAGMEFSTNPKGLREELHERHGVYPAEPVDLWVCLAFVRNVVKLWVMHLRKAPLRARK